MSRIIPLPPDTVAQIHSSKHIVSLQVALLSLLENSLDSGANRVEISVDFPRAGGVVEDNGSGIPMVEFGNHGGLGKMYHTSKRSGRSDLHGFSGTNLASLAALSLLTITSRHSQTNDLATLTAHHGKVIRRAIPAPVGHELSLSSSCGTRVTVADLFGNMPVRVKQRALTTSSGQEDDKSWQELKRGVVALVVSWPRPCSVRLLDLHNDMRKIVLRGHHPSTSTALTEQGLHQLNGRKMASFGLKEALPILFQSNLADHRFHANWIPVSASTVQFVVKGLICLNAVPTKQTQFISIGIRPCSPSTGYGDLYDAVNKIFSNSSFGSLDDEVVHEGKGDRPQHERNHDRYTGKQLRGRKGVDRSPMFILQVNFRDDTDVQKHIDNLGEGNLRAVVEVLEATVTQWLAARKFRPKKRRHRQRGHQQAGSAERRSSVPSLDLDTLNQGKPMLKRSDTTCDKVASKSRKVLDLSGRSHQSLNDDVTKRADNVEGFSFWSRIKSGQRNRLETIVDTMDPKLVEREANGFLSQSAGSEEQMARITAPRTEDATSHRPKSLAREPRHAKAIGQLQAPEEDHTRSEEDYGSLDSEGLIAAEKQGDAPVDLDEEAPDQATQWIDPVTKKTFQVSTRTGTVLSTTSRPKSEGDGLGTLSRHAAAINTSLSSAGRPLSLARRCISTPARPPSTATKQWLPDFLAQWQNPVFARPIEPSIPSASLDGPVADPSEGGIAARCTCDDRTEALRHSDHRAPTKLTKQGLRTAHVIHQVDRKYILCTFPGPEAGAATTLVLIDQHAASERIILETLLAELCLPADPVPPTTTTTTTTTTSIRTHSLDRPLPFPISPHELPLFHTHAPHFAHWGILYTLRPTTPTLTVTALPPVIAPRCILLPHLILDLLRTELWARVDAGIAGVASVAPEPAGPHPWLPRLRSLPPALLALLQSRACRSAVMFNDALSRAECEHLVQRLGGCAFPFVCAHGRVAAVPAVVLEAGPGGAQETPGGDAWGQDGKGGFVRAWRAWRGGGTR